jgi:hypothetical protein
VLALPEGRALFVEVWQRGPHLYDVARDAWTHPQLGLTLLGGAARVDDGTVVLITSRSAPVQSSSGVGTEVPAAVVFDAASEELVASGVAWCGSGTSHLESFKAQAYTALGPRVVVVADGHLYAYDRREGWSRLPRPPQTSLGPARGWGTGAMAADGSLWLVGAGDGQSGRECEGPSAVRRWTEH